MHPGCLLIVLCSSLLLPIHAKAQQIYSAVFVERLPEMNPDQWEKISRRPSTIAKDDRLVKYGSEAANQLTNDSVIRTLGKDTADPARPTSFMMAYNVKGWYLYIQSTEPAIAKAIEQKSSQILEIFFSTTHPQDPLYSRIEVNLITGKASVSDQLGRTDDYRPLLNDLQVKSEILSNGQAWGTCLFIPWEYFHDRLPFDGQKWSFTFMRWGTGGGVTWGGKVHEKNGWGQIEWQVPTDAQRQSIQKAIIQHAWKQYQEQAADAQRYWQTYENDVTFYKQKVQPLVLAYNQKANDVLNVAKLSAPQVAELYINVRYWMNFDMQIDRLRRDYLQNRLMIKE
jgi:hypothetical protein